jgi:hypothetical protein
MMGLGLEDWVVMLGSGVVIDGDGLLALCAPIEAPRKSMKYRIDFYGGG